ncbi:MAG: poly-gamma-glutamate capsule biosynthesis protein CapA/YwtB (metallophosphatase superfamily) [Alteromonadaceae bacterium]|jgi:poly-gamma-glutamate capsule biosynthesis protein CapA/YwtB (metallophosphatase superfamily)
MRKLAINRFEILRINMRHLLFITLMLCSVLFSAFIHGAETFLIEGRVTNEDKQPITAAEIFINGEMTLSDNKGHFSMDMALSHIYQLAFKKQGYYKSVHSYSHFELSESDLNDTLTQITLVAKKAERVMLAFGGDVMMGRRFYQPYFDDPVLIHPDNMLADSKAIVQFIKPYMSLADYAAVNLETQISEELPGERAPKSVTFYSKPALLDALTWAGIDYVTLGNNHTFDYMTAGLTSTMAFLNKSALGFSGAGFNEHQALSAHHQKINHTTFSMLGYVGWQGSSDPTQTANDDHGGAAFGSMDNMLSSIRREKALKNVVIAQYHGSQEYANNPTGVTQQRLKSSLDAGATIAIAHHPHVTQGLELYNGKLIAYSMGNFIFDQNFAATQHSFILYVWLDGDTFHRAEVVPLYNQAYKPTPATGMHRYTVMKRLKSLSQLRGTIIEHSGGHGIITAVKAEKIKCEDKDNTLNEVVISFSDDEQIKSLYKQPWQFALKKVMLDDKILKYRLGINLVNGSDFESFTNFNAPERGWLYAKDAMIFNEFGASGQHSMSLIMKDGQKQLFGMQSFRRVYKAANPMTIKTKLKSKNMVKASFYWQGRKKGQKLFDAFKNSEKHLIKAIEINDQDQWQNIEVDFNSPRIGYKSYRVLVEFEWEDNGKGQRDGKGKIDIDDFAVIEWQSAFSNSSAPQQANFGVSQASFIGINRQGEHSIVLTYE